MAAGISAHPGLQMGFAPRDHGREEEEEEEGMDKREPRKKCKEWRVSSAQQICAETTCAVNSVGNQQWPKDTYLCMPLSEKPATD